MGSCQSTNTSASSNTISSSRRGLELLYKYREDSSPTSNNNIHSMSSCLIEIIEAFQNEDYARAHEILYDREILNSFGYTLRSTGASLYTNLQDAVRAATKAMHKLPPESTLILPEVAIGTFQDLQSGKHRTSEKDAQLARSVLPIMLEEWIHMFQYEIGGFLSPDTLLFFRSEFGKNARKSALNEVDICAFYRDLGWHDILPDFYERYEERKSFRLFAEWQKQGRVSSGLIPVVAY